MVDEQGRILVADDEELNRLLLEAILKDVGYVVELARHGQEALELLGSQSFDVVLLDLVMPRMNGFEVLAKMQESDVLRQIPVIVISAMDDVASMARCIEMGAMDYLIKPYNAALLRARIKSSLASKRLHDMELAYTARIQAERERSERLLLNMLPQPVAEQLKQGATVVAESYPEATVLFADLVGFTAFTLRTSPANVIRTLNTVFSTFDQMVESRQLEKIKTSGDAYMVAGGVPLPRPDHAEAVADLALDMQTEMAGLRDEGQIEPLQIRIGINSGPVIAGVIGTKRFTYDLWGDTVNTASRMESNAMEGGILTTEATYARLRQRYHFEQHGLVEVKGKGQMMTYRLVAPATD